MSALLTKSKNSSESASYLYEEEKYCSSIHCAYYSCYQTMMYVYSEIIEDNELPENTRQYGHGSHNDLIQKIQDDLIDKISNATHRRFTSDIYKLKSLRSKADYSKDFISEPESRLAVQGLSTDINNLLSNAYNLS